MDKLILIYGIFGVWNILMVFTTMCGVLWTIVNILAIYFDMKPLRWWELLYELQSNTHTHIHISLYLHQSHSI